MIQEIGILTGHGAKELLRMWRTDVPVGTRPFRRHAHTRFEIALVISGRGEYTTEQAVYPMEPGDIFVFCANEVHCITACKDAPLHITNLQFEPDCFAGAPDTEPFVRLCFSHGSDFKNRIPAERAQTLQETFRQIQTELENNRLLHAAAVKAYLHLMLVELFRNHHYCPHTPKSCPFDMLVVYDYVNQHLCERITLQAVAELVHLSPNYFSHLFKASSGISLWDYITARRVERAVGLICGNSTLTVLQIALDCGFNSTVHFNKAFKKHTGLTPNQLRKNPDLLSH